MTFSFRPLSVSILPWTDASVSTRVVSWNDAAEMNDRVWSEALVIPSSTGLPSASLRPSAAALALIRSEEHTSELQSLMRISYAVFCLTKQQHIQFNSSTRRSTQI